MAKYSILSIIYKKLNTFDWLGPKPEFNLNGEDRFTSPLGFIFTMATVVLTILSIKYTFLNFILKLNPDVSNNPTYEEDLELNTLNFKFFINVFGLNSTTWALENIDKSKIENPLLFMMRQNNTGYYPLLQKTLVDCDDVIFENYNSGFISLKITEEEINHLKKNSYCMPNNLTVTLKTRFDSVDQLQIGFPFESYTKLYEEYDYIVFSIIYRQVYLDPNNFNNVTSMIWKQQIYYPNILYQTIYKLEIENFMLEKDKTFFLFSDVENIHKINSKSFSQQQNLLRKKAITNYDLLSTITLIKSDVSTKTLIKYKSLSDILAEFGGSFEMIRLIFELSLNLIIKDFYSSCLIDKLFNFHISTKKSEMTHKNFKNLLLTDLSKMKGNQNESFRKDKNNQNVLNTKIDYLNFHNEHNFKLNLNRNETNTMSINDEFPKVENPKTESNHHILVNNFNIQRIQNVDINPKRDIILNSEKKNEKYINELLETLKHKKVVKIKPSDYFQYHRIPKCCRRQNNDHQLSKVINKCEKIISDKTDLITIIKNGCDQEVINKIFLEKLQREFTKLPSINIENGTCLEFLNKIIKMKNYQPQISKEQLEKMFESDFRKRVNRKTLTYFLKNMQI